MSAIAEAWVNDEFKIDLLDDSITTLETFFGRSISDLDLEGVVFKDYSDCLLEDFQGQSLIEDSSNGMIVKIPPRMDHLDAELSDE